MIRGKSILLQRRNRSAQTLRGPVRQSQSQLFAVREFTAIARIDTPEELVAYRNGGILPYVLRQLVL